MTDVNQRPGCSWLARRNICIEWATSIKYAHMFYTCCRGADFTFRLLGQFLRMQSQRRWARRLRRRAGRGNGPPANWKHIWWQLFVNKSDAENHENVTILLHQSGIKSQKVPGKMCCLPWFLHKYQGKFPAAPVESAPMTCCIICK